MKRILSTLQGLFYVATGAWPLLHMPSFLAVTGPKTDLWLVNTVGWLVIAIGAYLLLAAVWREVTRSTVVLAAGSAAALAGVDLYYSLNGVIWAVYVLDAVAELALVVAWVVAAVRDRR